jgi:PIN domain nuclease of toxin-antitoxin system
MIFLDTNIIVRLYNNDINSLSEKIINFINNDDVYVSPVIVLELEYLFEIKRVSYPSTRVMDFLSDAIGLKVDNCDFLKIIECSINEKWTRDPFDRLIVSHAKIRDSFLLSTDKKIRQNYKNTIF